MSRHRDRVITARRSPTKENISAVPSAPARNDEENANPPNIFRESRLESRLIHDVQFEYDDSGGVGGPDYVIFNEEDDFTVQPREFRHAVDTPEFFEELTDLFLGRRVPSPLVYRVDKGDVARLYPADGGDRGLLASNTFDGRAGSLALSVERSSMMLVTYFLEKLRSQTAAVREKGIDDGRQLVQLLETAKNLRDVVQMAKDIGTIPDFLRETLARDEILLLQNRLNSDTIDWHPTQGRKSSRSCSRSRSRSRSRGRSRSPRPPRRYDSDQTDDKVTFMKMLRLIPSLGLSRAWRRFTLQGRYASRAVHASRRSHLNHAAWLSQLPMRIVSAFVAAIALLVPMLIMVIHPSYVKTLVTGSVAIAVFAGLMALYPVDRDDLSNRDLINAVGAYAAVQVVFIALVVPAAQG